MTLFTSVLAPECDHGPGFVRASPAQIAAAARAARSRELALLGQIHSHPGAWCEHSEGDDTLVLMPYENMISIVVPHYARYGLRPLANQGVHQFQAGRWTLITRGADGIRVVPPALDLRR
jgi:proteasome lid subunit RPN8/RPN11